MTRKLQKKITGQILENHVKAMQENKRRQKAIIEFRHPLISRLSSKSLSRLSQTSTDMRAAFEKQAKKKAIKEHFQQKMKNAKRLKDVTRIAREHRNKRVFNTRELMLKGGFPTILTYRGQTQNVKNKMNAAGFNKSKHVADKWKKIDWALYHTYNCIRTGECVNIWNNTVLNRNKPSEIFKFYSGLNLSELNSIGF